MKIAVTGKGGVGKTTIAGTLARLMGRDGLEVIAVDMDPNTNLAYTLGLNEEQVEKITPLSVNRELLKEKMEVYPGSLEAGFFKLYPKVDDIVELYGVKCADNVTLIVMGTIRDGGIGCLCPAHAFMRALLRHLILKRREVAILDMEAGIEHLARGTARGVDLMLTVIEPSIKSIETAKRIEKLARDIEVKRILVVANKIASEEERKFIIENLERYNLKLFHLIPYDRNIRIADMKRVSPLDYEANSSAIRSIYNLKNKILKMLAPKFSPKGSNHL